MRAFFVIVKEPRRKTNKQTTQKTVMLLNHGDKIAVLSLLAEGTKT